MNLGDFSPGRPVRLPFSTEDAVGAPITLAGTPSCRVRKGTGSGSTTTTGVTLTVDVVTGMHVVDIDTSNAFYAAGNDFAIELAAGTVDGVSKAGRVLGLFSIANRAGVMDVADGITAGVTMRKALYGMLAVALGKLSGAGTGTEVIRDFNDTKAVVTATVDASGNRVALTVDLT